MHVRVEAELGIDAEVYLLERDGAAFRSFISEEMSLLEYDIIDCLSEGRVSKIKIASKPDVGAWIPGPLAAKVPEKLEYIDTAFDPDKLAQGYFASRTIIEPLGPGRCRHVLEQEIRFKGLWGLGAVAQKLAKKSLEQSFADMPAIIDKWVRVRQELLQTPHGRQRLLAGRPKIHGVPWIDEYVAALQQASGNAAWGQLAHGTADGQPKQQQQKKKHLDRQPGKHHHAAEVQAATGTPEAAKPEPAAAELAGVAVQAAPAAGDAEEAMPPSAFATAAEAAPKHAPGSVTSAAHTGQLAASTEDSGNAVEAAAPAVDAEADFQDALERLGRQSTGETIYLSPAASLADAASAEPPAPAAAADADAIGAGWPEAGPRRRVQVQRATAAGEPLPAAEAEAGAGAGDAEGSRAGSSASASTASDESQESQELQEDWSKTAPWRAYYHQQGLQPLRRQHTLPAPLVRKFIVVRRPQPVSAQRLTAGAASDSSKSGGRRQSRLKSMFAPCLGRATTAVAE